MTLGEIKEMYAGEYVELEIFKFIGRRHDIHSDFIDSVDEEIPDDTDVEAYKLMDEEAYGYGVLANTCFFADFEDWYGDKNAKVLVIVLSEFWQPQPQPQKYQAQMKYDKANTQTFSVKLNNKTDSELIDWLSKQPNKQGAIKSAIKKYIEEESLENQ